MAAKIAPGPHNSYIPTAYSSSPIVSKTVKKPIMLDFKLEQSERHQSELSSLKRVSDFKNNVHLSTEKKVVSKSGSDLPEKRIIAAGNIVTREIVIRRHTDGSVPVALADHAISGSSNPMQLKQQKVILIEPKFSTGLPTSPSISGLLPGDMLVKVNDSQVEMLDCSEAWKILINSIESSGEVRLTVCPLEEMSEISGNRNAVSEHIASTGSLKRTASLRHLPHNFEDNSMTCYDDDQGMAWLINKTGIAAVTKRKASPTNSTPPGRCHIKLLNSDSWLDVDEVEVYEANPTQLDRVEDISLLHHINLPSILHTLRERYFSNLIHTFAGKRTLLIVRPRHRLAIYSETVMGLFHGCKPEDMPPHVFSIAQSAYDALRSTRRSQAILLLGYSNSGKTTNVRHLLDYFQHATSPLPQNQQAITGVHVNAVFTVLKSFFECQTLVHASATRCSHTFKLQFDAHSTYFVGLNLEVLTVDRTRFIHRPEAEPTFHVFYQMLAGIDSSLRKMLFLEKLTEPNLFVTPLHSADDQQHATRSWNKLVHAMSALGFGTDEINGICSTLAAIYHLGVAGVMKDADNKSYQFARLAAAARAAAVLGTTVKALSDAVFGGVASGLSLTGLDLMESFVSSLYTNVLHVITALINRKCSRTSATGSLASTADSPLVSIAIVDLPGMQTPAAYGRTTGASFEDLCQNYTVERLQQVYYDTVVTSTVKLYRVENIDCDTTQLDGLPSDSFDMVGFLDSQIRSPVRVGVAGSTKNLVCRVGLLLQLEDASNCGTDCDERLTSYLQQFSSNKKYEKNVEYIAGDGESVRLDLGHLHCSCHVQYNVTGWTKMLHCVNTTSLLASSSRKELSSLFRYLSKVSECTVSQQRQPICSVLKSTVGRLTDDLRRSNLHFIHCFLPCHITEISIDADKLTSKSAAQQHIELSVPVLRDQILGSQVLVAAQLHKLGFPEHMAYGEFLHHFDNLWPAGKRPSTPIVNKKQAVEQLLQCLDVNPKDFKLGLTEVFFRSSAFALLEENRDVIIANWILKLQAELRGCLSRRRLQQRKFQLDAVECIQSNVRTMRSIRQWSWWRLFTKLQPVLECNVQPVDVVDAAIGLSSSAQSMDRKRRKLEAEVERLSELARGSRTRQDKLRSEKEKIDAEKHATELQLKAIIEDWKAESEKARLLEDQLNELSASSHNSDVVKDLRNAKADLERKCEEAELQLEEQSEIISQLEQEKSRLESTQEKNRSRLIKDQKAMEQEMELMKETYQKKLRGIELQLEDEVSEKKNVLKEKRELEKKLLLVQQKPPHDQDIVQQLKMKIRKASVVIADKQNACEQHQQTSTVATRLAKQARIEVEDIQTVNAATLRAKKALESELESLQQQLDSAIKNKTEAEDRCKRLASQNTELQSQLIISDDETADIMKKYKALVQQNAVDLQTIQQQSSLIQDLQARLQKQKADAEALQMRLKFHQESSVSKATASHLEAKIKELESRYTLETTVKARAEKLLERSKARLDATSSDQKRLMEEAAECKNEVKDLSTRMRELQVQLRNTQNHDTETTLRNQKLEKRLKSVEARGIELSEDLELSSRRVKDLQKALNSCISSQQQQADDLTDSEDMDNNPVEHGLESEDDSNYDSVSQQFVRKTKMTSSFSSSSSTSSFKINLNSSSASASKWMASPRRTWLQDSQI